MPLYQTTLKGWRINASRDATPEPGENEVKSEHRPSRGYRRSFVRSSTPEPESQRRRNGLSTPSPQTPGPSRAAGAKRPTTSALITPPTTKRAKRNDGDGDANSFNDEPIPIRLKVDQEGAGGGRDLERGDAESREEGHGVGRAQQGRQPGPPDDPNNNGNDNDDPRPNQQRQPSPAFVSIQNLLDRLENDGYVEIPRQGPICPGKWDSRRHRRGPSCNHPTIPLLGNKSNAKNHGRLYYGCVGASACGGSFKAWVDDLELSPDNKRCKCANPRPCRMNYAGRWSDRAGEKFWGCADGECGHFEWDKPKQT